MTCIVAMERKGSVWLGSDSFLGHDDHRDAMDRPKWFSRGDMTFGYAGSFRGAQVVERFAQFRRRHRNEGETHYMMYVAEAVRKTYVASDVKLKSRSDFVVIYAGKVYVLQDDFSILRSDYGYAAIGAGASFAYGALAALQERLEPAQAVRKALEVAARHCPQVGSPFHVIKL